MRKDNREIVEEAGKKSKPDFNVKGEEMRGPIFFLPPAKDRGDQIYLPVIFRYQEFVFHGASVNSQPAAGSRRLGLIMMESSAIPMPR